MSGHWPGSGALTSSGRSAESRSSSGRCDHRAPFISHAIADTGTNPLLFWVSLAVEAEFYGAGVWFGEDNEDGAHPVSSRRRVISLYVRPIA